MLPIFRGFVGELEMKYSTCVDCGITQNSSINTPFKTLDDDVYCPGCLQDAIIREIERLKSAYITHTHEIRYEKDG